MLSNMVIVKDVRLENVFFCLRLLQGARYMYKHYQDALAICHVHGNPQYFITFTCNVKWPKIQRYLQRFPSLNAQDRPDIIARVFQMKVKSLMRFLKVNKPFGEVVASTCLRN